jgi:hypothetical protein
VSMLDRSNAVYFDTAESRGVVASHPASVPAMRGRAIAEADWSNTGTAARLSARGRISLGVRSRREVQF